MGNKQSYQQAYDTMNVETVNQIDLSSLDPYTVLNVPKNFTWEQLKAGYKDAALKTHPDKQGGNKVVFDFVTSCFKTLATEYKAKHDNRQHQDLKKSSKEYFEKMVNNTMPHPSNQNEPFEKRFNSAFEECKYHDEETEFGYGKIMANSTGIREEIAVDNFFNKVKVDNNTFNDVFNKKVPVSKDVVKYKEPEALLMAKNLQFTEIGAKRPDDYSSGTDTRTLAYTDYMVAYNGMRLANPDDIKLRKQFKSVEEYEKYRDSKVKKGLTNKEKELIEKQSQREEEIEFERQERIRKQNRAIQLAHDKANRLLIK